MHPDVRAALAGCEIVFVVEVYAIPEGWQQLKGEFAEYSAAKEVLEKIRNSERSVRIVAKGRCVLETWEYP